MFGRLRPREAASCRAIARPVLLVLLLVLMLRSGLTHSDQVHNEVFREMRMECAKGCEQRGNCNAEEGRCECEFGFGGEHPLA
jgi:hypothetical protein